MTVQFSSVGDVSTRTQEKETVTPIEDLPVDVWESPVKAWVGGGLLQGWGTDCSSTCMGSFEGGYCYLHSVQFRSVAQSCQTLCDPMDCSMPGLSVYHQLLEFIQTHVH